RPQSGGGYVFVGEAAAGTQNLHALNTFPANIPVQHGDIIGIFVGSPFGHCGTFTSDSGDTFDQFTGDPPLNTSTPVFSDTPGSLVRYPVSAAVTTPDAVPAPPSNTGQPPSNTGQPPRITGQRAAALKKCKKKFSGKAKASKRQKCVKKAQKLQV